MWMSLSAGAMTMFSAATTIFLGYAFYKISCSLFEHTGWEKVASADTFYLSVSFLLSYAVWITKLVVRSEPHIHVHSHKGSVDHPGYNEENKSGYTLHDHAHSHNGYHQHFHGKLSVFNVLTQGLMPNEILMPIVIYSVIKLESVMMVKTILLFCSVQIVFGITAGLDWKKGSNSGGFFTNSADTIQRVRQVSDAILILLTGTTLYFVDF